MYRFTWLIICKTALNGSKTRQPIVIQFLFILLLFCKGNSIYVSAHGNPLEILDKPLKTNFPLRKTLEDA